MPAAHGQLRRQHPERGVTGCAHAERIGGAEGKKYAGSEIDLRTLQLMDVFERPFIGSRSAVKSNGFRSVLIFQLV